MWECDNGLMWEFNFSFFLRQGLQRIPRSEGRARSMSGKPGVVCVGTVRRDHSRPKHKTSKPPNFKPSKSQTIYLKTVLNMNSEVFFL